MSNPAPELLDYSNEAQQVHQHIVPIAGLPSYQTPLPLDLQRLAERVLSE